MTDWQSGLSTWLIYWCLFGIHMNNGDLFLPNSISWDQMDWGKFRMILAQSMIFQEVAEIFPFEQQWYPQVCLFRSWPWNVIKSTTLYRHRRTHDSLVDRQAAPCNFLGVQWWLGERWTAWVQTPSWFIEDLMKNSLTRGKWFVYVFITCWFMAIDSLLFERVWYIIKLFPIHVY